MEPIDCGNYWMYNCAQRDPLWHSIRKYRVTASNFGTAAGYSNFSTPEELADVINEKTVKNFTPAQQANMDYGTHMEPIAREWYSKTTGKDVKETGIAIPKWNFYIGGSPDGLVDDDGLIEIKCVKKMYGPIKGYLSNPVREPGVEHIWKTHYAQMQGCMAIMERKWCDYIVFCPQEELVFLQRLPFDQEYWNDLHQKLNKFILKYLVNKNGGSS